MPRSGRPFYLRQLKHVRAVASPVRAAVLDALEVIGPATVLELAHALGYPPDGLYYHLAALERLGLIVRVSKEKETSARFDVCGRPVTIQYHLDDRQHAHAMAAVVSTMLRSAARGFRRAYAPGLADVDGPYRNLRAARRIAWLTPAELRTLNSHVQRIYTLFAKGRPARPNARLHEWTYVLCPSLPAGSRLTQRHRPAHRRKR